MHGDKQEESVRDIIYYLLYFVSSSLCMLCRLACILFIVYCLLLVPLFHYSTTFGTVLAAAASLIFNIFSDVLNTCIFNIYVCTYMLLLVRVHMFYNYMYTNTTSPLPSSIIATTQKRHFLVLLFLLLPLPATFQLHPSLPPPHVRARTFLPRPQPHVLVFNLVKFSGV